MSKNISQLSDAERAQLFPIILQKHNPVWSEWYEKERENLLSSVEGIADIHHYGSTAIPGILAKPTIDILIEVEKSADLENLKNSIIKVGYNFMSYGKEPSMMFVKGYTVNGFAEKVFHIHVYYVGVQHELLFRDYLIAHPETAHEYESMKIQLKEKYEFNRDAYTEAKSIFINSIVKRALSEKLY